MDPIYSLTVVMLIAFVFAFAGSHKLMNYARQAAIVADYRVVAAWLVPLLAPLIIVLELAVVVLVLLPGTRLAGFSLAIGLLLIYMFAIGLNLVRGRTSIDCGCGWGSHGQQISVWLIVRNMTMIVVIVMALLPSTNRSLHLVDWILAAIAGTALIAIYSIGDLLIANWSKLSKLKIAHR